MADVNLLEVLDRESKIDNIVIYGNIRCAISKPNYLSDSIGLVRGFFALVDVLALQCTGVDYFSVGCDCPDSRHIYFSRGSIVVAIEDSSLIGRNVKVFGRTSKGCTIKKQKLANDRSGVVGFAWTREGGNWYVVPNRVSLLLDRDIRGTVLEEYVISPGSFSYPESVGSLACYSGVESPVPLSLDDLDNGISYSTDYIDLTSVPLNLMYRLEASPRSEFTDMVGDAVKVLRAKSKGYSVSLINGIRGNLSREDECSRSIYDIADSIVDRFVREIAGRYNFALSSSCKVRGKDFIDSFLDELGSVNFRGDYEDEDSSSDVLNTRELYRDIEKVKKSVALDCSVLALGRVGIPLLGDSIRYASLVIGCVTGIGLEGIVSNFNSCRLYNDISIVEWFWCLVRNPYLCGLLGGGISVVDCDRVFCGFCEGFDDDEVTKCRDMLLMLDRIRNASSRSTLIDRKELVSCRDIYPAGGRKLLEENRAPFSRACLVATGLIRGMDIVVDAGSVGLEGSAEGVLGELNDLGIIEEVNDGIILTSDLYKEYVIYSVLFEKGSTCTGITDKDICDTITFFEGKKGFRLEALQRDGINLIKYRAGVLSGCAGSGKTTTSDCMVEGIRRYLPEYELRFGAPTGKAARRLAEVVGGNVKTIHSMFGLGLGGEPYIARRGKSSSRNSEGVKYAYILDEMAMSNTGLMYDIVRNLGDEDLVYFLGDIKQLSPIGKGNPFRSLMRFLPCVELGVSKRAAENGKINYNCGLINFVSDDCVVELQEGDDFIIHPCADVDIPSEVVSMFRNMLYRYDEDDIQVVTGYQTDRYLWSTVQLNPLLQKLLRDPKDILFNYNNNKFMKNDRVIHVKRNAYDMPRFRWNGSSVFEEVVTFGIVNGELGKVVGYVKASDCTFFSWVEPDYSEEEWKELDYDTRSLIEKRRKAELRNESCVDDDNAYFVVVKVYDVDLKEDVVVLYHANHKKELDTDYYCKTFVGGDLKYLDLAYALTTHKMQGSQSKAIIIPLGSSSSRQFMNRNMLNTMITRASEEVALVGSVRGRNSALTNGRRNTNINEGEDVLSLLVN